MPLAFRSLGPQREQDIADVAAPEQQETDSIILRRTVVAQEIHRRCVADWVKPGLAVHVRWGEHDALSWRMERNKSSWLDGADDGGEEMPEERLRKSAKMS